MPTIHHEDHVLFQPQPQSRKAQATYVACVAVAIGMVAVGWILTLRSVVSNSFAQAKTEFSTATEAWDGMRAATVSTPTTPLEDIKSQFQEVLDPYMNAAVHRKEVLDATIEITKLQLEPYGEQGTETTE